MNREIKFRGKGMQTGKWREGLLITNKLGYYIVTESNPHECTRYGYLEIDEYERVHAESVGQYTGLKDENDVEIFEGDIVRVTNDEGETNFVDGGVGSVGNIEDLFIWYINGQVQNGLYELEHTCYIEVIGKVYDNPELLEETK